MFVRRVSRQIRDVAGGEDPVEGAVNGDPQGFLLFCFFFVREEVREGGG